MNSDYDENFARAGLPDPRKEQVAKCFLCGEVTEDDGYCPRCDVFIPIPTQGENDV